MPAMTDPATAVVWITATGGETERGEPVRAYGKDPRNYLVAVRTDTGTWPVDNLPAILAARRAVLDAYDAQRAAIRDNRIPR